MAFKMTGMSFGNSPLKDHKKDKDGNVIKHLSDENVDALHREFKTNYDKAKTDEEKNKLRKTFKEATNIYKRRGINP